VLTATLAQDERHPILTVAPATAADLAAIKQIAVAHKLLLGFVSSGALAGAQQAGTLLCAREGEQTLGYIEYYVRQDGQVTIYSIAVAAGQQRLGIGRAMLAALGGLAVGRGLHCILLKCTADNPANHFYAALGFALVWHEQPERGRALNVWRLTMRPDHCGCL